MCSCVYRGTSRLPGHLGSKKPCGGILCPCLESREMETRDLVAGKRAEPGLEPSSVGSYPLSNRTKIMLIEEWEREGFTILVIGAT